MQRPVFQEPELASRPSSTHSTAILSRAHNTKGRVDTSYRDFASVPQVPARASGFLPLVQ